MYNIKKLINIDKAENVSLSYNPILDKYTVIVGMDSGSANHVNFDSIEGADACYGMIKSMIKNHIEIYEDQGKQ